MIEALFVILVSIIVFFAICGALAIVRGITLSVLWGWFIVPLFALPPLGIVQAIGLMLVINFLTFRAEDTKKEDPKATLDPSNKEARAAVLKLFRPIGVALTFLTIGWIVKLFV